MTTVDPGTVTLKGMAIKAVGKGSKLLAHIEEMNGDCFPDLMMQIQDADGAFAEGSTLAELKGNLFSGQSIIGADTICIKP